MEGTIGTMVDAAAEHTRDLVEQAGGIASELADVARGVTVAGTATTKLSRRAKRHARKASRKPKRGRSMVVRVIVIVAIGAGITIFIRRRQAQSSQQDVGPAPDAFGAAVRAEHEVMGNGAARATATPGA